MRRDISWTRPTVTSPHCRARLGNMACTFSPNLYLKAQDGHNCDASLWINEQGHISAEPLEMFLWEIRVQVMQNQVAIAMGNRVGTEGDVAFAGQSVVVDP